MKPQEKLVDSSQSEGEADPTYGLSGGAPSEEPSLAELVESPVGAEDEESKKAYKCGFEESPVGAKDEASKKEYKCRFCDKTFEKPQALGGHMNGHPEARNQEKLVEMKKLVKKLEIYNTRDLMPETTAIPYHYSSFQPGESLNMVSHMTPMQSARLFQQPQQQMEPSQAWHTQTPPVHQDYQDPAQLWPQASTNDFNLSGASYFPSTPNLPTNYDLASPANYELPVNANYGLLVNANYGSPSMDPSMSRLTSPQYMNLPVPSSMPSSNSAPYRDVCCNPQGSGTYQDPQVNMQNLHTLEQANNSSSTLNRIQPRPPMPPNVQMNNSSYVQHAPGSTTSRMGTQVTASPQSTRFRPSPCPSDACNSGNHGPHIIDSENYPAQILDSGNNPYISGNYSENPTDFLRGCGGDQ